MLNRWQEWADTAKKKLEAESNRETRKEYERKYKLILARIKQLKKQVKLSKK